MQTLKLQDIGAGRALLVRPDGRLYLSRGYSIYASDDDGRNWTFVATAPIPPKRRPGQLLRLAARLLRFEIRALVCLPDDTVVAANRDWVFYSQPGQHAMQRSRVNDGAQPLMPPLVMALGPGGRVVFGEYDPRLPHGNLIRIFVSDDGGRSFETAHCLGAGEVMHVHRLLYDPQLDHYWVFTGDFDNQAGIGVLTSDFAHFDWLVRGEQRYRLCDAFDFDDRLVYATDTPLEQNAIVSLDKSTGRTETLALTGGSCLYAARFGNLCVLSTTSESLSIDACQGINLWVSRDGDNWSAVLEAEKDVWHANLFQFGSLILPRGISNRDTIFFSGQAVQRYDGKTFAGRLS